MSRSAGNAIYSLFYAISIVMGVVALLYTMQGLANLTYTESLVSHLGSVIEGSVKKVMSSFAAAI